MRRQEQQGDTSKHVRSMLFVPGDKPEFFGKLHRFRPDAVLFDLEDAVSADNKADARRLVRHAVQESGLPSYVRINPLQEGGLEDIESVVVPGLRGIVIPKAETADEVRMFDRSVGYQEGRQGMPLGSVRFFPAPESALGIHCCDALVMATDRVAGLVGVLNDSVAGDVARSLGIHPSVHGVEQSYICSRIVLSSRAAGANFPMAALVGMKINDLDAVRRLAQRARSFGYVGAMVVHPSHLEVVHEVFTLSSEEIEYLTELVSTFRSAAGSGNGVISFRGAMVDVAMARYAEQQLLLNIAS